MRVVKYYISFSLVIRKKWQLPPCRSVDYIIALQDYPYNIFHIFLWHYLHLRVIFTNILYAVEVCSEFTRSFVCTHIDNCIEVFFVAYTGWYTVISCGEADYEWSRGGDRWRRRPDRTRALRPAWAGPAVAAVTGHKRFTRSVSNRRHKRASRRIWSRPHRQVYEPFRHLSVVSAHGNNDLHTGRYLLNKGSFREHTGCRTAAERARNDTI